MWQEYRQPVAKISKRRRTKPRSTTHGWNDRERPKTSLAGSLHRYLLLALLAWIIHQEWGITVEILLGRQLFTNPLRERLYRNVFLFFYERDSWADCQIGSCLQEIECIAILLTTFGNYEVFHLRTASVGIFSSHSSISSISIADQGVMADTLAVLKSWRVSGRGNHFRTASCASISL